MLCTVLREFYYARDRINATRLAPGPRPIEIRDEDVEKLELDGSIIRVGGKPSLVEKHAPLRRPFKKATEV